MAVSQNDLSAAGRTSLGKVLVVERSATLRHVLRRALTSPANRIVEALASSNEALMRLRTGNRFDAIVLGAPPSEDNNFLNLLGWLAQSKMAEQCVLIAQEDSWLHQFEESRLPGLRHLPWSDFRQLESVLPERDEPEDRTASSPSHTLMSEPDVGNTVQVLLIDDSETVRRHFGRLLQRAGFAVEVADCLAAAQQAADQINVDLFIIDFFLPDGTGAELCARLKTDPRHRNAQFAVLTGTYDEQVIRSCLDAGATECMFKDESQQLFLARVRAMQRNLLHQRSIYAERQRLDGILGAVGDGVYGVDGEGRIRFVNPATLKILGFSGEHELLDHSAREALHFSDIRGQQRELEQDILHNAYLNGDVLHGYESVFWNAAREPVPIECTVLPLTEGDQRQGSVVVFRDISDRKNLEQVRWEAEHDPLTGLMNLRRFRKQAGKMLGRLRTSGAHGALLYIDLDRFSTINDTGGRVAGDRLLVDIASRLGERIREGDILTRHKDDHFLVALPSVRTETLLQLAEGFRKEIESCAWRAGTQRLFASASIGVALMDADTPSLEQVFNQAHLASQIAKLRGRNRVHLYVAERDRQIAEELASGWGARLQQALTGDGFRLELQPVLQTEIAIALVSDGRMPEGARDTLFDATLQLSGEDGEWLGPEEFMPAAERLGMAQDIDRWRLTGVLDALQQRAAAAGDVSVCIKLSGATLMDRHALERIRNQVAGTAIGDGTLVIAISDPVSLGSVSGVRDFMHAMRALGCRFMLDDFGGSRSTFAALRELPLDLVKFSSLFSETVDASELDRRMVASINEIAHSMGLDTLAAGINHPRSLSLANELGIDFVQGVLVGKPLSLERFVAEEPGDIAIGHRA